MSYKILIVEDQEMAVRQASINVKKMGYEIAGICSDGLEAIEFVKNEPVDLVLMDVMLPGEMDGFETAIEINKLNLPILIITALDSDDVLEKVKEIYAYGYLVKPYSNGDFKRAVQTALNMHQLRSKLQESEERFKAVIDDQLEMVCRFLPSGELTFYNRSYSEFFIPENELGRPANFFKNITIKDREKLHKSLARITHESPITKDLLRIVRGVKICWLEITIRGFFDAALRIKEYQAVAREISDKIMAEESLKKITDRYHIISEMTSDFVYTASITNDGGVKMDWIAGAYTKLTGWTFDEYKNFPQGLLSIVHPDDLWQFPAKIELMLKNKTTSATYRARAKSGEWLWFRDHAKPIWDEYERKVTKVIVAVQNVTEFKKAEEALKESEERLKFALEASVDGYWDWDLVRGKMFFSARTMEMLGRPSESIEFDATDADKLLHPEDRDRYINLAYGIANGAPDEFEVEGRFCRIDGGYRRILSRGKVALKDEEGKPLRITGVHFDVTDRFEAEQKLIRAEEKFGKIFQSSPIMISITTLEEGRYIEANDTFLNKTGFSAEEVIGKTVAEIGVWADLTKREEMKSELLKNGVVRAGKNKMRTKSGEVLDILHFIEILELDGEKRILSSIMDITEFNREKEQRSFVEETLKAIMDVAPMGVGYQIDRKIVWVNDKFCEMTGYTAAELIGQSAEMAYATKDEFDRVGAQAYKEDGSVRRRECEVQWMRKDGILRDYYAINCQVNSQDPSQGYIFVIIDITDSKIAEREKGRIINEKLELEVKEAQANALLLEASKYASVGAVIGGILHEINQPLNAIKTGSEGLLSWNSRVESEESKLPTQAVSVLVSFTKAVDHIEQILTHLDAYRRNAKTMAITTVDVNDCIVEATNLLKERLLVHRIELALNLWEEPIEVETNNLTLELIVANLLNYFINLLDNRPVEKKIIEMGTRVEEKKAIISIISASLGSESPKAFAVDSFRKDLGALDIEPEIIKMYVDQFGGALKLRELASGTYEIAIEINLAE